MVTKTRRGVGVVVGREIDTYVRPATKKMDQVRWKFSMKKGGQVRWKNYVKRTLFQIKISTFAYILYILPILYIFSSIVLQNFNRK